MWVNFGGILRRVTIQRDSVEMEDQTGTITTRFQKFSGMGGGDLENFASLPPFKTR